MADLADLSMVEAAEAVRRGDATSMELLDACWRNMEAVNPRLNATIWLDREGAEEAARAAVQRAEKGLLAHCAIFGQITSSLPHEPDRRWKATLPIEDIEKWLIHRSLPNARFPISS